LFAGFEVDAAAACNTVKQPMARFNVRMAFANLDTGD
jgi:hypothetical protein